MRGRFPSLAKVTLRFMEIVCAAVTSALVAYVLGHAPPSAMPGPATVPAVVQLAPADEEMIRTVHVNQAALLDQLRSGDAAKPQLPAQATPKDPPTRATTGGQTGTPPAKPGKSASVTTTEDGSRRDRKVERARPGEAKAPPEVRAETPRVETRVAPRLEELQTRPVLDNPGVVGVRNSGQREAVVVPPAAKAPVIPPVPYPPAPYMPPPPAESASAPAPFGPYPPPESAPAPTSPPTNVTSGTLPWRERLAVPEPDAVRPPVSVGEHPQNAM